MKISLMVLWYLDITMKVPSLIKYWIPPHHGSLKMNVDGAFEARNQSDGWGFVIIQNHEATGLIARTGITSSARCPMYRGGSLPCRFTSRNCTWDLTCVCGN
jgi:hypothetical protein